MAGSSFLVPGGVLVGELVAVFSTPCRGFCSGLKATREGPVGLTRMLLSVFLNSAVMFLFSPKVTFLELDGILSRCMAWGAEATAVLLLAFLKNSGFGKKGVSNRTKSFSGLSGRFLEGLETPPPPCEGRGRGEVTPVCKGGTGAHRTRHLQLRHSPAPCSTPCARRGSRTQRV